MSALKKLSNAITSKDLHANSFSQNFYNKLPIIEKYIGENSSIVNYLLQSKDEQNHKTNVKGKMTNWFMHHTNDDFNWVCDQAIALANENNPTTVILTAFDCWEWSIQKMIGQKLMPIGLQHGALFIIFKDAKDALHYALMIASGQKIVLILQ